MGATTGGVPWCQLMAALTPVTVSSEAGRMPQLVSWLDYQETREKDLKSLLLRLGEEQLAAACSSSHFPS